MEKYSSRRWLFGHEDPRGPGAECEEASAGTRPVAGGVGASREDRSHLCQLDRKMPLFGWRRRGGPGCAGSWGRSVGSANASDSRGQEGTKFVLRRKVELSTRLVRQHRPYGSPFIVGEFVAHDSSTHLASLNHGRPAKRKASGSAPVRRLRAEADINLPTIPDESVENDPKATLPTPIAQCRALADLDRSGERLLLV